MKSSQYLLCIFCLVMIIFEPGCLVIHGGPYVYDEVEIDVAPPPPPKVVVTRPPRPSSIHVWIEGHYIVTGGRWVWSPGRWEKPRHRGKVWVPPQTRKKEERWGYRPGHWR